MTELPSLLAHQGFTEPTSNQPFPVVMFQPGLVGGTLAGPSWSFLLSLLSCASEGLPPDALRSTHR